MKKPGNKINHVTQTKHGLTSYKNGCHPVYRIWLNMKNRCYNIKFGKGNEFYLKNKITVCDEWKNNAKSFCDWAISNGWQKGLCIDRIDSKGQYCPENCQFISLNDNARKIHIDNPLRQIGKNNHMAKLTENDVRRIRVLISEGKSNPEISKLYNVKPGAISQIRNRTNWKHVV